MTSTAIVPIESLDRMAEAVVASKLFGMANKDQALALMLVAQAEGLHPATAARDYHIIQGRPSLKADAMLARYLNSGGKVTWQEHTDEKVVATFAHPAGGTLKIEWDIARARKAGLAGKDNWTKYPRQMLRARVISEGIRATNPAVNTGIYTPEEVQDIVQQEKDMGRAEIVPAESGPAASPTSSAPVAAHPAAEAGLLITDEQAIILAEMLQLVNNGEARFKKGTKLDDIRKLPAADFDDAVKWCADNKGKARAA